MTTMPRCLLNGRHTPGSEWERECPLTPAKVQARHERALRREANKRMARAPGAAQPREGSPSA